MNRRSASARPRSSRGAGRRFAVSTWRSAIPNGKSPSGIGVEVEHGARTAVVGDNGQGKTTFLRTIVDSLQPLAGEVRWGHGCNDRHLRPARLHEPAAESDGVRVPGKHRPRRDEDPGDLERGRLAAVPRARRQEERSRSSPAASGRGSVSPG